MIIKSAVIFPSDDDRRALAIWAAHQLRRSSTPEIGGHQSERTCDVVWVGFDFGSASITSLRTGEDFESGTAARLRITEDQRRVKGYQLMSIHEEKGDR